MADDDDRAVRQVLAQFVEAWNARNADAFANLYTDPHMDVNHSPSVETRAATVAALRKRFEHSAARLSVSSEEIIVFGDWAVERGVMLTGNGAYIGALMRPSKATPDFMAGFSLCGHGQLSRRKS